MDKERHELVVAADDAEIARRNRRVAARPVDAAARITISGTGACRLYYAARTVDGAQTPLRADSEEITTRQTLHLLAEALPRVLDQAVGSAAADHGSERGRREPCAGRGPG